MVSKAKEERIKQLQEHIEKVEQKIEEQQNRISKLNELINDIKEFSEKKPSEFLAPISDGIFVKSEVQNHNTFHVNIGDGVISTKSTEETIALLKEQKENVTKSKRSAEKELRRLYKYVDEDKIMEEDDVSKPQR